MRKTICMRCFSACAGLEIYEGNDTAFRDTIDL